MLRRWAILAGRLARRSPKRQKWKERKPPQARRLHVPRDAPRRSPRRARLQLARQRTCGGHTSVGQRMGGDAAAAQTRRHATFRGRHRSRQACKRKRRGRAPALARCGACVWRGARRVLLRHGMACLWYLPLLYFRSYLGTVRWVESADAWSATLACAGRCACAWGVGARAVGRDEGDAPRETTRARRVRDGETRGGGGVCAPPPAS